MASMNKVAVQSMSQIMFPYYDGGYFARFVHTRHECHMQRGVCLGDGQTRRVNPTCAVGRGLGERCAGLMVASSAQACVPAVFTRSVTPSVAFAVTNVYRLTNAAMARCTCHS